jgi:hypothetical protein
MRAPFGKGVGGRAVPHAFAPAEYVLRACLKGLFWASMNVR